MCKVYKALGHVYDSKILDMVFFLSLLKGKKMTWTISFHNDWTDFVVVLIFLTYFKTYNSCFLLPYCKTILWKTLFFAKKILKKGRKKTSPDVTKYINQLPDFFRAGLNESGQSHGGMTWPEILRLPAHVANQKTGLPWLPSLFEPNDMDVILC